MCVCEREGEKERKKERENERERERVTGLNMVVTYRSKLRYTIVDVQPSYF